MSYIDYHHCISSPKNHISIQHCLSTEIMLLRTVILGILYEVFYPSHPDEKDICLVLCLHFPDQDSHPLPIIENTVC